MLEIPGQGKDCVDTGLVNIDLHGCVPLTSVIDKPPMHSVPANTLVLSVVTKHPYIHTKLFVYIVTLHAMHG